MQSLITYTLYALALIIPLVFTPTTSELFEFPKFLILLSGTLIIAASWAYHSYKTAQFKIKLNTVGYGVLAILATQTLATIFSLHPYTSFWGYYGRFHQGLLTTICYTIIYFAATTWLDTKSTQKLIKISIKTAIFVGVLAILEHYGYSLSCLIINFSTKFNSLSRGLTYDLPWNSFFTNQCWSIATNPGNRSFSLLGQPNWLAAYLIPNIFLSHYYYQTSKNKSSVIQSLTLIILFVALLLTKSRSGFIAFILSLVTYWILLAHQFSFKKIQESLKINLGLVIVISLILGTPYTSNLLTIFAPKNITTQTPISGTVLENGGTESGDIRKIVWSGALKLILNHPILGTGPETFAYTYYNVRPMAHNQTSEWDYLYNKAHNEYLNIASGAGLLGLAAYLYFHYAVFAISLTRIPKSKKTNQSDEDDLRRLYPVIGASIVSFAITNFFGFSVIPVYFGLIVIANLPTTLIKHHAPDTLLIPYPVYLAIFALLLYPLSMLIADRNYTLGKQYFDTGNLGSSIPLLQKAVKSRPGLDLYHAQLGEAYATIGQKDLALSELQTNKKLNPIHLNFFKTRAKIYLILAGNDPSYNLQAAREIEEARLLAPTDPKLAYNLGLVYTRLDNISQAEQQLKDAIAMKPNYAEPYYALTLLYEQTKQTNKITPLLTEAKTNLATYSAQLKEKIDKYSE